MTAEGARIEGYLAVGLPAAVQTLSPQGGAHCKTAVRGRESGEYLLLDRPVQRNRYVVLPKDSYCLVRFLSNGLACGYQGKVIEMGPSPLASRTGAASRPIKMRPCRIFDSLWRMPSNGAGCPVHRDDGFSLLSRARRS